MAKTSGFMAEFKQFIARGNVMDMAVGVISGTDAQGIFNGKGTLTRAQFAVLLARLLVPDLRVGAN